MTSEEFKWSKFKLGPLSKFFCATAAPYNVIKFAIKFPPFIFLVTPETFNFVSSSPAFLVDAWF